MAGHAWVRPPGVGSSCYVTRLEFFLLDTLKHSADFNLPKAIESRYDGRWLPGTNLRREGYPPNGEGKCRCHYWARPGRDADHSRPFEHRTDTAVSLPTHVCWIGY